MFLSPLGCLMALLSGSAAAFDARDVVRSSSPIAGTNAWSEYEHRLAFTPPTFSEMRRVPTIVQSALNKAVSGGALIFPRAIGAKYGVFHQPGIEVFKDIYFDTDDFKILATGSGYRLRYRWSDFWSYQIFQFLPFLRWTFPIRCEIQFKTDYDLPIQNLERPSRVLETRFEFRNESDPFRENKDAPLPPWPESEFIRCAETGRFRQFIMKPAAALANTLLEYYLSQPVHDLHPVESVMRRDRFHLIVPNNPWGTGPNPQQVVIISIDENYARGRPALLEIEIQIERNTLDSIEWILRADPADMKTNKGVLVAAKQLAAAARSDLFSDIKTVSRDINRALLAEIPSLQVLSPNTKYRRLVEQGR